MNIAHLFEEKTVGASKYIHSQDRTRAWDTKIQVHQSTTFRNGGAGFDYE